MALNFDFQDLGSRSDTSGKYLEANIRLIRKKMNFTTDLLNRNPLVSYIVASAVHIEKFFADSSKPGPVYRLHAVIFKENRIKMTTNS